MFRRIFGAVYAPIKWNKAYGEAVNKRYHQAVTTLEQAYKAIEADANYQRAPYDFNLLLGSLLCKIDDYERALEVLTIAREQIQTDTSLSEIDKEYLTTFSNWNIWYAADRLGNGNAVSAAERQLEFDKSQLPNVKSRFLRAFPLSQESLS